MSRPRLAGHEARRSPQPSTREPQPASTRASARSDRRGRVGVTIAGTASRIQHRAAVTPRGAVRQLALVHQPNTMLTMVQTLPLPLVQALVLPLERHNRAHPRHSMLRSTRVAECSFHESLPPNGHTPLALGVDPNPGRPTPCACRRLSPSACTRRAGRLPLAVFRLRRGRRSLRSMRAAPNSSLQERCDGRRCNELTLRQSRRGTLWRREHQSCARACGRALVRCTADALPVGTLPEAHRILRVHKFAPTDPTDPGGGITAQETQSGQ